MCTLRQGAALRPLRVPGRAQRAHELVACGARQHAHPHSAYPASQLDPQLAAAARRAVGAAGLQNVEIICGDAAAADVSDASVLALYLSASGNQQLLRALAPSLRPGTRVVSHFFPVAGWERSLVARSVSRGVDLYCYRVDAP